MHSVCVSSQLLVSVLFIAVLSILKILNFSYACKKETRVKARLVTYTGRYSSGDLMRIIQSCQDELGITFWKAQFPYQHVID